MSFVFFYQQLKFWLLVKFFKLCICFNSSLTLVICLPLKYEAHGYVWLHWICNLRQSGSCVVLQLRPKWWSKRKVKRETATARKINQKFWYSNTKKKKMVIWNILALSNFLLKFNSSAFGVQQLHKSLCNSKR